MRNEFVVAWERLQIDPIPFLDGKARAWPVGCELGEGAIWNHLAGQLVWFDIVGKKSFRFDPVVEGIYVADLPVMGSAAAIVDSQQVLMACDDGFYLLPFGDGCSRCVRGLESDNLRTRSNDGRVDPSGRFWIGTMARDLSGEEGSLYRLDYDGSLEIIRRPISVANSTAFSPDGTLAYFADSPTRTIEVMPFDKVCGTIGTSRIFAEIARPGVPDGSVCDALGGLWNAEWDGKRITRYRTDGSVDRVIDLPVRRPTCPAFGGRDLDCLFVTTGWEGLDPDSRVANPLEGALLELRPGEKGIAETVYANDGWLT